MTCRVARKPMSENDKYLEAFPLKLETQDSNMNENDLILLGAKLDKHEGICEERYKSINGRLKRIEAILMGTAAMIITMLVGVLFNG